VARVERVLGHAPRRPAPVRRPAADVIHGGLERDHAAAVPDGRRLAVPHLPVPVWSGVPAPIGVGVLFAHEKESQLLFVAVVSVHCVRKTRKFQKWPGYLNEALRARTLFTPKLISIAGTLQQRRLSLYIIYL
jgi:hypothetical protein